MGNEQPFRGFYEGRKVFVTGHTGFKGAWLALWLTQLGADVTGFSLDPPTEPNLFQVLGLQKRLRHLHGDIRDRQRLQEAMQEAGPEVVFHLAAQPIVRDSYADPVLTYETNVMGTLNVLEAIRGTPSVRAAVLITTDKVYRNDEKGRGFGEDDPLGGHDPYSASKACAEILIESHRKSFFADRPRIASARAGNVIGGGDWAKDRIIPDLVRAVAGGKSLTVRNPSAIRPWQHVLEPLAGYLWLAATIALDKEGAEAWNFGPEESDAVEVEQLIKKAIAIWGRGEYLVQGEANAVHEAKYLKLDIRKAGRRLGWRPAYGVDEAIRETIAWHKAHLEGEEMVAVTVRQIEAYTRVAREKGVRWAQ